jgi:Spherulation-specific family 4
VTPPPVVPPAPAAAPLLVVPAYFHPAVCPQQWQWLAEHSPMIRLVILNVASGPGTGPQPPFLAAVDLLHGAGVRVIGYVDTGYARRDTQTVLAEVGRYQDWYGVQGVCFDQVSTGTGSLGYYAGVADRARAMGAEVVFFNHGTHPAPGYARHADLLGTFEGTWPAYQRLRAPAWTRRWPPSKFYHVVYSVPAARIPAAWQLAACRRAGAVYITERGGANPYNGLPEMTLPEMTGNGAEAEPK